jgi:hypothetical protein
MSESSGRQDAKGNNNKQTNHDRRRRKAEYGFFK